MGNRHQEALRKSVTLEHASQKSRLMQNVHDKSQNLPDLDIFAVDKPVAKTTTGGGNKDGAPGGGAAAGGKKEKKLTTLLEDGGKAQNIEIALKSRSITAEQVRKRICV